MSIDDAIVLRRLALMRRLLDHLVTLGVDSAEDLEDLGTLLQVERVLSQLVNLAADINAHVAASTGLAPQDYRDGFDRMAEESFISGELARQLKPSVGLRNVLIHEYVEVDSAQLSAAIPLAILGYDRYIRSVAEALRGYEKL